MSLNASFGPVAPAIALPLSSHWYFNVGLPTASTVNVAEPPSCVGGKVVSSAMVGAVPSGTATEPARRFSTRRPV